jgi:uncharacterized protein
MVKRYDVSTRVAFGERSRAEESAMSNESCPLPSSQRGDADHDLQAKAIRQMLDGRRIAVVGLSDDPSRAAYRIAAYIRSVGKEVIPVNPNFDELMGVRCYPNVAAVPGTVDVVDVFRRAEFCPEVVRDAVTAGARGVWLQSGIVSDEARRIAREAAMPYVEDRCYMVEHMHRS